MSGIKIRKSQILQPFGVGAIIEAEGRSYVVKPTTSWKTEDMYDISIGSLAGRIPSIQKILTPKDGEKDGKTIFQLPVKRFPRWYFCSNNNCRKMYRLTDKEPDYCTESKCKKKQLIAMRWIMICEDGHMWDIPWQDYCHRNNLEKVRTPGPCNSTNLKFKTERGGDFDQKRIVC